MAYIIQIKASDIDFWNFKLDFMKLKHKMKMYPPRVKLTVKVGPSIQDFKLSIRFEGCLDEECDTELIFPLESPISHMCKFVCFLKCLEHVCVSL